MFKLIAFVFLVVNGQVVPEPKVVLSNKTTFASEDLCTGYFDTPEGLASQQALNALIKDQPLRVEFKCVKIEDETI